MNFLVENDKLIPLKQISSGDKILWVKTKTKRPCYYFAKHGFCKKEKCRFSHTICKNYQNFNPHLCKKDCSFVHMRDCSKKDCKCKLRHAKKILQRPKLCPKFAKTGIYEWGCELNHDVCELHSKGVNCDGTCNKHHMKKCTSDEPNHDILACNFVHD